MIKIAIVEDEKNQAELLTDYLNQYATEKSHQIEITYFPHAIALLDHYKANFDIILMDIRMPYMDGMEAARRLRKLDTIVILIFITNLMQYAIQGYEVDAIDYILKPIGYYDFALKISRTIHRIPDSHQNEIIISAIDSMVKIQVSSILYLESEGHHVIYHTTNGSYRQYSSLTLVESNLSNYDFYRCNHCYLVNMQHVQYIKGYTAIVNKIELQISQPRKKAFVQKLKEYTKRK